MWHTGRHPQRRIVEYPLTIKFNTSATQISVQVVLDRLAYSDSNASIASSSRTLNVELIDNVGAGSPVVSKTIHVT